MMIACSDGFIQKLKNVINPYEKELTSQKIYDVVTEYLEKDKMNMVKKFYDLPILGEL